MTAPVIADALGPRGRRRALVASVVSAAALVALVVIALGRFADRGQLDADRWAPLGEWLVWKYLLGGLVATVKAAGAAMALALVLGAVLTFGRLSRRRALSILSAAWIELFRGFPLLVLMLFSVYGLRAQGIDISTYRGIVLALTLYNSAVFAEIFRAGILSLHRGQREAAVAVGLTDGQAMHHVVLPQAIRRMTPAIVNQLVTLLKDTSLGFAVGYNELLRRGQLAGQFDRNLLQSLIACAALYIAVNITLGRFARWLERRQGRRVSSARPGPLPTSDLA